MRRYGKAALHKAHSKTTADFRTMLSLYTGGEHIYCDGDADFAYIPRKHAASFVNAVRPFDEAGVAFIYIYGSVIRGLVPDSEIIHPGGVWMWGYDDDWKDSRMKWASLYDDRRALVHPMKIASNAAHLQHVSDVFRSNIPSLELESIDEVKCPDLN